MNTGIEGLLIPHTMRLPLPTDVLLLPVTQEGETAARQFDSAVMLLGFKCSHELLVALTHLSPFALRDLGHTVLPVLEEMVGAHHEHNVYFREFPQNIPDTHEFWFQCLLAAVKNPDALDTIRADLVRGDINLLSLPDYGIYLHSYSDMLTAHEQLLPSATHRVTLLHPGDSPEIEAERLFRALATTPIATGDSQLDLLRTLAQLPNHRNIILPIPLREHRAVINAVRVRHLLEVSVDTITDVLRLACELSHGDVTLFRATPFTGITRAWRRILLSLLDAVVRDKPHSLTEVVRFRERWKRLGERVHPHEFPSLPHAATVFAVARGERAVSPPSASVEHAITHGDIVGAATLLSSSPTSLYRAWDRLLRRAGDSTTRDKITVLFRDAHAAVPGRVLLSVREHVENRLHPTGYRVFVNRKGKAYVRRDDRIPLEEKLLRETQEFLDETIRSRLAAIPELIVDPALRNLALPLSGKASTGGFAIRPRGSFSPIEGEVLRFFMYWRERSLRTDFDLSAIFLDHEFQQSSWLSYTRLSTAGGVHSGDITSAPEGATEFIDCDLTSLTAHYVIPQINIYAGESFGTVAESFFGYMIRSAVHDGLPFEARTVHMRSEIRDAGRVAMPLVFLRDHAHHWTAFWLHVALSGVELANRVEENWMSSGQLVRSLLSRRYLRFDYLIDLFARNGVTIMSSPPASPRAPVTYLGLEDPGNLPAGSTIYSLTNLTEILPP